MIKSLCDWLVYSLLGIKAESSLGVALNFFLYDSIKIILLLYVMIGVIGVFRTYISPKKVKQLLSGRKRGLSYVIASLFGAVTPFCSCSSIPLFISFIEAGVPLGPAFSFLVTSPLINEYLAVLMLSFFGWEITTAYIAFGLLLGISSRLLISKIGVDRFIAGDFKYNENNGKEIEYRNFRDRVDYGIQEASSILKKLWLWILLGVGIGALIHGFIPEEAIQNILDQTGLLSVPLATLIGVPIYANCSAVVPIAAVLFQKGVPLGTALAFMMATSALSLPEAVILRRVMKIQLIMIFFGIVTTEIILIGYIFNLIPGP